MVPNCPIGVPCNSPEGSVDGDGSALLKSGVIVPLRKKMLDDDPGVLVESVRWIPRRTPKSFRVFGRGVDGHV
jgi:hypothetical protein